MNEAMVTINGRQLMPGEVDVLRMALGFMVKAMDEPNVLGDDVHAVAMAKYCSALADRLWSQITPVPETAQPFAGGIKPLREALAVAEKHV